MNFKIFLLALVISCSFAERFNYTNFHLLRLTPQNDLHLKYLIDWESTPDFDFWTSIKGLNRDVDVVLSPSSYDLYKALFDSINLPYNVIDSNIQDKIERQSLLMKLNRQSSIVGRYVRYNDIINYIDSQVNAFPNLASSYVAGKSYEKRDLKVIVLGTPNSQKKVWIDCGIHAREWVSPSTCIWVIDKLISEYNSNVASTVDLLNYYEFHILPSLNPDGYEYSHTTYRLWRKNRRPNTGSSCFGTDLNRNFGYKWLTGGSSTNPCSDTYAGPSADSEPETKAVESAINAHLGDWDAYLTIHSYGLWWFTTWGYTSAVLPSTYNDQVEKANIGVSALQSVYNTRGWVVGSSAQILYIASGGSEDWAAGTAGVKYANCIELRPGQSGTDSNYGFTLPEDRAPKVGEETYQGIKAFVTAIKNDF